MNEAISAGGAIRAWRESAQPKISLDDLADKLKRLTRKRPSTAKLSRIETGKQPVPQDIIQPLAKITGIPAKELRPDLAAMFEAAE